MKRFICWLFGHDIRRYLYFYPTATRGMYPLEGLRCTRCGKEFLYKELNK